MVSDIETHAEVQIIPIAAITVENPRERSEKTFRALVDTPVMVKRAVDDNCQDQRLPQSFRHSCTGSGPQRLEAGWRGGCLGRHNSDYRIEECELLAEFDLCTFRDAPLKSKCSAKHPMKHNNYNALGKLHRNCAVMRSGEYGP